MVERRVSARRNIPSLFLSFYVLILRGGADQAFDDDSQWLLYIGLRHLSPWASEIGAGMALAASLMVSAAPTGKRASPSV
jgi:hypothetical protein